MYDIAIEAVKHGHDIKGYSGRKGEDMKVFITGVAGQLGHDVVNELEQRGYESIGSDIAEQYSGIQDHSAVTDILYVQLDITDKDAVRKTIEVVHPDVIIHCAAWTAVDAAEDEENQEKVDAINHLGTQYMAEAAKAVDAKMVYISTDYVFDGQGERPWNPDDKVFAPLNVYGKSKLDGEMAVVNILKKYFIVRIAWVFGLNGNNFIKTMLRLGKERGAVSVVNDQIGMVTYTYDLARLVVDMIQTKEYGTYHATNSGDFISWYDFAKEIFKQAGMDVPVTPVDSSAFPAKAKRPKNSRMNQSELDKHGFNRLPDWHDALARYLKELND